MLLPNHPTTRSNLDVLPVVPQRSQPVLVRIPKVAQQQVDVGAVGGEGGVEGGVAALHLEPGAILLDGLPQVELLLVAQPRFEGLIALVLQQRWRRRRRRRCKVDEVRIAMLHLAAWKAGARSRTHCYAIIAGTCMQGQHACSVCNALGLSSAVRADMHDWSTVPVCTKAHQNSAGRSSLFSPGGGRLPHGGTSSSSLSVKHTIATARRSQQCTSIFGIA